MWGGAQLVAAIGGYRQANGNLSATIDAVEFGEGGLPIDPFGEGESLRYLRSETAARGYIVYSIGPDRVDDGGALSPALTHPSTWFLTDVAAGDWVIGGHAAVERESEIRP